MSGAPQVVTVSFPPLGRQADYVWDPRRGEPRPGDLVVVEGFRGHALGRLIAGPHKRSGGGGKVRSFVRTASEADLKKQADFERREDTVLRKAIGWARDEGRPWKVVRVVADGLAEKFTICFAASERQDCKEDAAILGRRLGARVELRQLGMRDAARTLGGLGRCGRELCCSTFLPAYPKSNIRLAKEQNLALAGDKTSGVCGKTLCCLSYEADFYKAQLKWLPRPGKRARTVGGLEGRVVGVDVFRLTFDLIGPDRRRQSLPAAQWVGNAGKDLPEPEIAAPASAQAVVQLGRSRRPPPRRDAPSSPPSSSPPHSGDKPSKSRRRRRGKKDPT